MTIIDAVLLGIVQGITEFLPVSSSGHIAIGAALFGIHSEENLLFTITVHFATALATVWVFRKELNTLSKETLHRLKFTWNESRKYIAKLLVSTLPILIVGLMFKDDIAQLFDDHLFFTGTMLICTGCILFSIHFIKIGTKEISFQHAFIVGIAQTIAILPGISRSGATIVTALMLGIKPSEAAKFSFLMVLIPIFGATFLELESYLNHTDAHDIEIITLLVGFIAAFFSSLMACKWMLSIVKRGNFILFALYCGFMGSMVILSQI